ncbi:MAG: dihydroorotate dehydrogenase [Methylocystaceae bacterium]
MPSRNRQPDLQVNLGRIKLKNPVTVASGTFGYGREYLPYCDVAALGAVIVKGTTLEPRAGNPPPRITETPAGMLNAIGLENPGVEAFIQDHLPKLMLMEATTIANIAGNTIEEYAAMAKRLEQVADQLLAIELNISCPNVKQGGMAFGTDPVMVREVTSAVTSNTSLPVIVKLSPNVTDIVAMARAASEGGAEAVALINTLLGMAIDIKRRRPVLANTFGGLSGPAIKPVALRMVYQVARETGIPIMGEGGIMNYRDVLEFIMAGASCISVGTANFINPGVTGQILQDLFTWMENEKVHSLSEIKGCAVG